MSQAVDLPSCQLGGGRMLSGIPAWAWLLTGLVSLQFAVAAVFPVLPEEAYHWNFGRHPDCGYFDHPPMLPWAIALGRWLLGDTALGVRLVPLLFAFGTTWLLARMARRFYGANAAFWAVLLHGLQPAAFFIGGWGFPDSPVLFFWMLALTLVWQALDSGRPGWWLAAGAALGAGMLSKYTAAFLVPSIFLYLIFSKRDRRWLVTPWPYLAGCCALVVFAPVIYWNGTHEWASFRFQSTSRFQAADSLSFHCALQATAEQWFFVLPLTLPLAVLAIRRLVRMQQPSAGFLLWSFVPMASFFFVLGFTPSWHLLWSLPAYLGLTVAMAGAMAELTDRVSTFYRNRWMWLAGIETCGVAAIVLHGLFVLPGVPPLRETYGWDEAAEMSKSLRAHLPANSFYMTASGRSYPSTSQLAFHLNLPFEVFGQNLLGWEALQYRFWVEPEELAGRDAVVVVEGEAPPEFATAVLLPFFQSVELRRDLTVPVGKLGSWSARSARFTLFVAHGYLPSSRQVAGR